MSTRSAGPSAVWVSGAFGFGDDLAYFRQVFAEFARRLPGSVVMVREGFPVDRYADLPLEPRLRFWTRRRDRVVDGFVYTGHRRVPTLRTAWRLLRWPADVVVVVEFTPTALVTAATAHLARRRVVHLVESTPDFRGGADGRLARTVKGLVIGRSTVVQASNEATARYVVERLGVDPTRVRTGPYLTSQPSGVEPTVDDGGPVRFLFLNSLQRRKGLHLLLPALAEAGRDGDHAPGRTWTLDVVGDGPERESAIALAEALGVADRVRWHGRVDHAAVAAHYAAAHVVCCPTQGDYRSLAGFEAVNAGRPVVLSTRDGAAAEICAHADAAVAVDPLDGPALRTALARYLRHDGFLADQLAAAATPPAVFGLDVVGENLAGAVRAAAR
ncbi:glycosyltransferase [Microlunatus sp. Y2014]|uniref:glycosyltransferase n=1 Tax=Microlunatus sp. Y2014 TaxID=3418488 RepID=UPI003DA70F03